MTCARISLCILGLLAVCACLCAQTPQWNWAHGVGTPSLEAGEAVAVDADGNVLMVGYFFGTTDFGPLSLTSAGYKDILVAKLAPNGDWLWVQRAGGTTDDLGRGVAVDGLGNVYVTGNFSGTADFGSTNLTCNGYSDVFVAKLDSEGNWLWATRADGPSGDDSQGIAVDGLGNAYVTGHFQGTALFGSTTLVSSGGADIFAAKLDGNGNWLWAVKAGGGSQEYGVDITVDCLNNSYLTGYFSGLCQFGSINLTSSGGEDVYVAGLDTDGNWLWAKKAGGSSSDTSWKIALDGTANVWLTGTFSGTAAFGGNSLSSAGTSDIFAAKLDNAGNWQWAARAGGSSFDYAYGIITDGMGDAYLTGCFKQSAQFGSTSLTSSGEEDIFAAKLSADGGWLWAIRAGSSGTDYGYDIAIAASGILYLTGWYGGNASFGGIDLAGFGVWDIFVASLGSAVGLDEDLLPPPVATKLRAWPNPFVNTTKLSIVLPSGIEKRFERVDFSVYDLRGRKVRTLETSSDSSGQAYAVWDGCDSKGQDCPSGIYLTRISAGGKVLAAGRLSLVK